MARTLAVWLPLDGRPQAFVDRLREPPARWLPAPGDARGPGHYGVGLRAGPIERMVTCAVGEAKGDDRHVRIRLDWRADPEPRDDGAIVRALPDFSGTLEVEPTGERRANLRLDGSYESPDGPIGAAIGPAQMQEIAESAARAFLSDVAANLAAD